MSMNHDSAPPGEQAVITVQLNDDDALRSPYIWADAHSFMDLKTFVKGICAVFRMDS